MSCIDRIPLIDLLLALWAGISAQAAAAAVRPNDRGFLIMTDKYPGTLFGFVPNPFTTSGETE